MSVVECSAVQKGGGALTLFVTSQLCDTMPVDVELDATVADLEAAVKTCLETRGVELQQFHLTFGGEPLMQADAPLADLGVCPQSMLELVCRKDAKFVRHGGRVSLDEEGRTATNSSDTAGDLNQFALGEAVRHGVWTWRFVSGSDNRSVFVGVGRGEHPIGRACGCWGPDAWMLCVTNRVVYNDCNWREDKEAMKKQVSTKDGDGKWEDAFISPGDVVAVQLDIRPEGATMRMAINGQLAPKDPVSTAMISDSGFAPLIGFMGTGDNSFALHAGTSEDVRLFASTPSG